MAETNGSVMEWSFDLCPSCSALVVVFYPSFIYLVCWCKRFQLITKNEAWFGIFGDFFFFSPLVKIKGVKSSKVFAQPYHRKSLLTIISSLQGAGITWVSISVADCSADVKIPQCLLTVHEGV